MLVFDALGDFRMGRPGACRAPQWGPPAARWFAPPSPAMADLYDDVRSLPPSSPQSDSDSSVAEYLSPGLLACGWAGCRAALGGLEALAQHVAAAHAALQGGLFYCGWHGCERKHRGFNARYKMLVHVRTHTNEKPHKCSQCEKSFSRAENLKIHTRSHSGEKPYVCPVEGCNKAYSNSSDRFKHTRTHSVDKPYCCKVPGCQKRYTDPSSLRKHVKTYKHISVSPVLPEVPDLQVKLLNPAMRVPQNITSHYAEKFNYRMPVLDEKFERNVKHIQRKYSYSENDTPLPENAYKINLRSQTPPIISSSIERMIEERSKYCFCRDSPCLHSNRYPSSEYIKMDGSPYSQSPNPELTSFSHMQETSPIIIEEQYVSEPLNLKRCRNPSDEEEIYENGVLNLEKKVKTEIRNEVQEICDVPLDLSVHRTFL